MEDISQDVALIIDKFEELTSSHSRANSLVCGSDETDPCLGRTRACCSTFPWTPLLLLVLALTGVPLWVLSINKAKDSSLAFLLLVSPGLSLAQKAKESLSLITSITIAVVLTLVLVNMALATMRSVQVARLIPGYCYGTCGKPRRRHYKHYLWLQSLHVPLLLLLLAWITVLLAFTITWLMEAGAVQEAVNAGIATMQKRGPAQDIAIASTQAGREGPAAAGGGSCRPECVYLDNLAAYADMAKKPCVCDVAVLMQLSNLSTDAKLELNKALPGLVIMWIALVFGLMDAATRWYGALRDLRHLQARREAKHIIVKEVAKICNRSAQQLPMGPEASPFAMEMYRRAKERPPGSSFPRFSIDLSGAMLNRGGTPQRSPCALTQPPYAQKGFGDTAHRPKSADQASVSMRAVAAEVSNLSPFPFPRTSLASSTRSGHYAKDVSLSSPNVLMSTHKLEQQQQFVEYHPKSGPNLPLAMPPRLPSPQSVTPRSTTPKPSLNRTESENERPEHHVGTFCNPVTRRTCLSSGDRAVPPNNRRDDMEDEEAR